METKEITGAIIKVMTEVNNIGKNTTVGTGNNSYKAVSDKDVKQAIRASMIKNGLSIIPTCVEGQKQIDRWEEVDTWSKAEPKPMKTKQSVFTEVTTKYLLLHTSGESLALAGYGQGVDTQDKGAGKATTYALKNTLINLFLVPTGEDTDNTHSDDIPVAQKKQYTDDPDLPWFKDENLQNLIELKKGGKKFTMSDIRKKYKVATRYVDDLNEFVIN